MDWSFADQIQCINLYEREDRYQTSSKIFKDLNIPVIYFRESKSPKGGKYGIFMAHIKIIQNAYDKGCNNVLIFEDDLEPTKSFNCQSLDICRQFIKECPNWDLFYFGSYPNILNASFVKYNKSIIKGKFWTTHAYMINRPMMKRLYDQTYRGIEIDYYLANIIVNAYAFQPPLFIQDTSVSSLRFQVTRQPRANEFGYIFLNSYARYVNFPVIDLFIIVVFIIIIIIISTSNKWIPSRYNN